MHRSGTSALASVLDALGLDVGLREGLMRGDIGNPDGYFEVQSVAELDERILAAFGGRWDIPPLLAAGWANEVQARQFAAEARETFDRSFAGSHFVLKDPRMSLLMPMWRQVLLDRVAVVMIVRDPAEVAWSLALRDGMAPLTGLGLWAAYNRALLTDLDGLPVHVCHYRDLVDRPGEVVADIARSLNAWGELDDTDTDPGAQRVRPDLRRDTHPGADPVLADPPASISELAAYLGSLDGRHDEFHATAPAPGWWEEPLLNERRVFVQHYEAALAERDATVAAMLTDNAALRAQADELRGEVSAAIAAVRELEATRAIRLARAFGRGPATP